MQRQWVNSSNLSSVGYEEEVLEVEFKSRKIYHYYGIPESLYQALMQASSKGGFLNAYIIDRFRYARVA